MSPVWMQYDDPRTHRPFAPQRPEQQSPFAVHVLLAVTQVDVGERGWQVPPLQLPEQQALPATGHAAPIVRHCTSPHLPAMQAPLQQSVLPTHAAVAGAQVAIDEAQVPEDVSHTPEQHDAPNVHAPPYAVQSSGTDPSGPKPIVASDADAPSDAAASPALPSSAEASLPPGDLGDSVPHAATRATSVTGTQ
jgi:hypothetical protein